MAKRKPWGIRSAAVFLPDKTILDVATMTDEEKEHHSLVINDMGMAAIGYYREGCAPTGVKTVKLSEYLVETIKKDLKKESAT